MKNKPNAVFIAAAALVFLTALAGMANPQAFAAVFNAAFHGITSGFGWLYPVTMTAFVVFAIWIGFFSKFRNMRLGPDDSKPDYSNKSWFAMLFSAGMGVGLVFWCVAEPLNFFAEPIGGIKAGTGAAKQFAFTKVFLHWGLHPWACYTVIALAIAYMQFRRNKPLLISSLFIPLVGEKRTKGALGKVVDVLALLAAAGGVCTTLGLGVLQINSGMKFLFGIPTTTTVVVATVLVLTVIYVATACAGVEKGMSKISNANIYIAAALAVLFLIVGPTVGILKDLFEGIGSYLQNFISNSFAMGAFGDSEWYGSWTIYYWAWWIAWSPFTGAFIARISRGRTVREFVAGVLFLPAIASMVWFAIFGTMGMDLGLDFARQAIGSASTALFMMLVHYPLGRIAAFVFLALCVTFFWASATGACTSLGMYSEGGTLNPSNRTKFVWGVLLAFLALSLMLSSSDGLTMLKTLSIVVGFPFAFIGIATMVSMVKALREESPEKIEAAYRESASDEAEPAAAREGAES